jgi:hypothetical protein
VVRLAFVTENGDMVLPGKLTARRTADTWLV